MANAESHRRRERDTMRRAGQERHGEGPFACPRIIKRPSPFDYVLRKLVIIKVCLLDLVHKSNTHLAQQLHSGSESQNTVSGR